MLPSRLLDELIDFKRREYQHAQALRESLPELEPPYVRLLKQWQYVFGRTLEAARFAEEEATLVESRFAASPARDARIRGMVNEALLQSQAYGRQLQLLQQDSQAVQRSGRTIAFRASDESDDDDHQGPEPADSYVRQKPQSSGNVPPQGAETSPVPIGGHKLPPLPYAYNALEPYIDEKTMRIHHDIHHKSYVDGLNKAELKLADARRTGDFDLVKHWERELAFNGAGHYLHTIFWDIMKPGGGGQPSGALAAQIARDFGSYDAFKTQFSQAASKVEGSGWAILVWSPRAHRLEILTAEKHQNLSQWDVVPLLTLDVWEHAYYLKHQNKRDDYVKDWWNVVNWPYVATRFAEASKLQWTPY